MKSVEKPRTFANCSTDLWEKRMPSPHDKKLEHIAEGYWASKQEGEVNPGSIGFAWRSLKMAIRDRLRALPCRWLFHIPNQKHHPYSGATYCTRCGAWRGQW